MAFTPRSIQPASEFAKSEHASKLGVGDHICEIIDTRFTPESPAYNEGYFFDLKVLEGAKPGTEVFLMKRPDDAKGGGKMTAKMAKQKDQDRVQAWLGACFGYDAKGSSSFAADQLDTWNKSWEAIDPKERKKGTSPASGRKVIVRVFAEKNGYVDANILPYAQGSKASAPAVPALPKAPVSGDFASAAKAAGYLPHPAAPGFMVLYVGDEPKEVVSEADVKARLGL